MIRVGHITPTKQIVKRQGMKPFKQNACSIFCKLTGIQISFLSLFNDLLFKKDSINLVEKSIFSPPFQEISNESSHDGIQNAQTMLKDLKIKNHKGIIIAYLNINSIRNKFKHLQCIISDNIDILTIAETKLDLNFTTNQFLLEGFRPPFRYNRNSNGG